MTARIGYSTGALAKGDLTSAVAMAERMGFVCIELSSLRLNELSGLADFVATHTLDTFRYVSIHAPTDFPEHKEADVVAVLAKIARARSMPVIIHPDSAFDWKLWGTIGSHLCIENMDARKLNGRTVEELAQIFEMIPDAGLCFDIAHARQVDSSMTEAYRIIKYLGARIVQMHFSELGSDGKHYPMSENALRAYRKLVPILPQAVPVLIESPSEARSPRVEFANVELLLQWSPIEPSRFAGLS